MARRKTTKQEEKDVVIPLDWYVPDNVPTHRATNAVIERLGDEFVLSFFEQRGPVIITEDDRKKARELKSVKALCVARIYASPERLEGFVRVIKEQLNRYTESKGKTT